MELTDLRYSKDHEWVAVDGDIATVGITTYAAQALGDVVYVDLPEVGTEVEANGVVGEVESTKSVSDLFCPVPGSVTETNEEIVPPNSSTPIRSAQPGCSRSRSPRFRTTCSTRPPTTSSPRKPEFTHILGAAR